MNDNINIDGNSLTINDIIDVANNNKKIYISHHILHKIKTIRQHVNHAIMSNNPYYGINTGFGALAKTKIANNDLKTLQLNLIKSHAVGIGEPIPPNKSRAIMLLRLNTLAKGYSGCREIILQHLMHLLNNNCAPFIPSKGSVGASGDLAPLSHLALLLIGEGKAFINNTLTTAKNVLSQIKLPSITLHAKEGIALINGTQAMSALACFAIFDAIKLNKLASIISSCTIEGLMGLKSPFKKIIQDLKPYKGQKKVAQQLRSMLKYSKYNNQSNASRIQDAYSIRCIPQVHGAIFDAISHAKQQILIEINSVTDNPLIFVKKNTLKNIKKLNILSCGNFHGQPLALILDYLAIALSTLSNISERRIEHLVNPNSSFNLPPFLISNAGLNSGFMILHVLASSLVNENKVLSHPASSDSIPTSANKEDFVSMGMTSANKLNTIINNTYYVLSLELISACQAIDFRQKNKIAKKVLLVWSEVRKTIMFTKHDKLFNHDIEQSYKLCKSNLLQYITNM